MVTVPGNRASTTSPYDLLIEFHRYVGAPVRAEPTLDGPGDLRRCDFIEEEARELREAVASQDLVAIADALGDLVYCVYGAALHFGIDLDAVVAEIHRSNKTKTPAGRAKAVKGPGYSAPRLESILARPLGAVKRCADQ